MYNGWCRTFCNCVHWNGNCYREKDDQTETIEQLNQTISEQSRRIMNTEGQLARYKRELAEATGKNEA